jgi:hypothetical protein
VMGKEPKNLNIMILSFISREITPPSTWSRFCNPPPREADHDESAITPSHQLKIVCREPIPGHRIETTRLSDKQNAQASM